MRRTTTIYPGIAALVMLFGPGLASAQYTRVALLEEFTSMVCKPCTVATPIIHSLMQDKGPRVEVIKYHVNIPFDDDPYYQAIKEQMNGRKGYYDVNNAPFGVLDGAPVSVTVEGELRDRVDARLLQGSPVKVEVTHVVQGGMINVAVKLTAGEDGLENGEYRLRVVAVEEEIEDTRLVGNPKFNGETQLGEVVRSLVNGVDGDAVTLGPNETKTLDYSYAVGSDWNAGHMYAVAFVQNDNTSKEVLQTGSSPKPMSSVTTPTIPDGGGMALVLAPNPAMATVAAFCTLHRAGDVRFELYDMAGARALARDAGFQGAGRFSVALDVAEVPAGVYTCVVRAGDRVTATRLVIAH